MASDWSDQVPSRQETEARAADERTPLVELLLDVATGVVVVLMLVGLAWAIYRFGGGLP